MNPSGDKQRGLFDVKLNENLPYAHEIERRCRMMKCVFTIQEWHGSHKSKSELYGEDVNGRMSPLMPVQEGVRTILTVTEDGYKLMNVNKEVLRQGVTTDVFEAFDSMPYK